LNKNEYLAGAFDKYIYANMPADSLKEVILEVIPNIGHLDIGQDTPLISSGIIDSFSFISLITAIEKRFGLKIPHTAWRPENFETLADITKMIKLVRKQDIVPVSAESDDIEKERADSLSRLMKQPPRILPRQTLAEYLINHNPLKYSAVYSFLFRIAGINVGKR